MKESQRAVAISDDRRGQARGTAQAPLFIKDFNLPHLMARTDMQRFTDAPDPATAHRANVVGGDLQLPPLLAFTAQIAGNQASVSASTTDAPPHVAESNG